MARSLLRWTSLIAGGVVLYVVGVRRLHLQDFNAFLLIVLAVAVVIVAAFVATRGAGAPSEHADRELKKN